MSSTSVLGCVAVHCAIVTKSVRRTRHILAMIVDNNQTIKSTKWLALRVLRLRARGVTWAVSCNTGAGGSILRRQLLQHNTGERGQNCKLVPLLCSRGEREFKYQTTNAKQCDHVIKIKLLRTATKEIISNHKDKNYNTIFVFNAKSNGRGLLFVSKLRVVLSSYHSHCRPLSCLASHYPGPRSPGWAPEPSSGQPGTEPRPARPSQ